ncbi:YheC/YheD family endospore coat-associated protein [Ferviditalea candida]|uniref:YheC/YheD family protein n=1 Tax=Ferviditalea candida TaxID=3108399 RepID=A0ABU5ZFH0_9BACL|nr:YheC/YheD family protein [Paenibacillaceae bacterium T2]
MDEKYVGILLNQPVFNGIPKGRTGHERISLYEENAKTFGLTPCYFRLSDLKIGSSSVRAYVSEGKSFKKKTVPVPRVIHNRAIFFGSKRRNKVNTFVENGFLIFNQWNRYGKLTIHRLLMKNPSLQAHLPETAPATPDSLSDFLGKYSVVLLKPDNSSIGRGIIKIERIQNGWLATYRNRYKKWRTLHFTDKIPCFLHKKMAARPYLVQQFLNLATYRNRPFDLRVAVQRNGTGNWQITGLAAKVARRNRFLTNVAQGGTAHKLETVLQEYPHLKPNRIQTSIEDLSLQIAEHLSRHLPNLADLGLDIGLTPEGFPLFIECNNRDRRIILHKAGLYEENKALYRNPIAYAQFLHDRL